MALLALATAMTLFSKSMVGYFLALTALIAIFYLVKNYRHEITKDNMRRLFRSKYFLAVHVVFFSWLLSSFFALDMSEAMHKTLTYYAIAGAGFALYGALITTKFDIVVYMKVAVILGTICAFILLVTGFYSDILGIEFWGRYYGSVLTLIFPMALYLTFESQKKKQVLFWLFCVLITASGVMAPGGRTAWLTLIGLLFITPFLYPWVRMQKHLLKYTICLLLVAVGAWVGMQSYKANVGDKVFAARTVAMSSLERPASGRLTVWNNTIPYVFEKPWLGHGIESTPQLIIKKNDVDRVRHAHNIVFELWLETGLLGLLVFSIAMFIFLKDFMKAYFRSPSIELRCIGVTILLSGIVYAVTSLSLTSIFNSWWFLYLIIILILLKLSQRELHLSIK